ncbi:N-carbamoyl-L-amino-acid hydrolase [Arboricoccus pini]|uniref:N-carbamoyl-L-amino-acid hydrolase n=1 Tax=Arboricoccus pini TaxID=1963835 RepID=A0A212R7J4_9PROT|nr:Zn-dependent hydrolase [Arboricoccus pini]SNB68058.1 N-carbamoyl-L-amino-acid hydrolase [Arboricoccus pini]
MNLPGSNMKVDKERLWESLMEMAKIGGTPKGGCNRQTVTDLDAQGRALFRKWVEAAGCTVTIDEMGNMMALKPGRRADLPPVVIGSHLDTQPTGGKFDGVLGVLSGVEILRTLQDTGYEHDHPIMVVNWTNEEGGRFAPAMMASGVWAGAFTKEWAYASADRQGFKFGEELERIGYRGALPCEPQKWKCHLEFHIEQGPILEAERLPIGVVVGGQGIRWYECRIHGKDSHAGSTPMPRRKDALVAASRVIADLDQIARRHAPHAVITVGQIDIEPGSRNVIPSLVKFSIDVRHPQEEVIETLDREIRASIEAACERDEIAFELDQTWYFPPVQFDATCVAAIRQAADELGYGHKDMVSGPGHDSCYTARHVPTAMIFCPCKDGLSHNEEESIEPHEAEAGANVLLRAALQLAQAS